MNTPNKAIAGAAGATGGIGLAGSLVAVAFYALGIDPPQAIVVAWTTIVTAIITPASVFLTVYITHMEEQMGDDHPEPLPAPVAPAPVAA